jgi:HPt (histidine-containing phosphotransfer) domain-containing protein
MSVTSFGSNHERQRLAQFYAALSDGELQQLARDAESLTDSAKAVLLAELARRKMALETLAEAEDSTTRRGHRPQLRDLLTIRQFRDLPEALLAKSVLDSAGIECFLGDDNLIRMDWLWSNLLGGIKLRVRQEDALIAAQLLEGEDPPEFDSENSEK